MCLQGPIIEMVGIQTLVQTANDLVLACNVEPDKITVHGYWKTVELFRSEVNSLFQAFAGQTFTRETTTSHLTGTKSGVVVPKHFTSAHLPPKTTAHSVAKTTTTQSVTSTIASTTASTSISSSVTASVDRLFASTTVSQTPGAFTTTVSTSSMHTRTAWDSLASSKGKSLPGSVQVLPLEIDLVRITPEVPSSFSTTTSSITISSVTTASMTHASLSSAGIYLSSSSYMPTSSVTTTTTGIPLSSLTQMGITQQNVLESSHSDILKSPSSEVKSKIDTIEVAGGQTISLKHGDIVKETVDVIVNPANSFLKHEGGVAKAIDNASDGLVQLFSDELVARDGVVPVGGAKYTQAGGQLKCKYVVHTVGPDARKHSQKECETLLKLACENSLVLADALKATSVAFPAISAGIYSVDVATVARIIIKALVEYKYPATTCLRDVQIIINDQGTFDSFKAYFVKKRKSLGKSREKHTSSSARAKSNPMIGDHRVTAAAAAAHIPKSSVLPSSITTTIPSYTFPSRHHRSGSLDLDYLKKTKTGSTGYAHSHDQFT